MNERRQPERMLLSGFSKQSFPVRKEPARGTWEEEKPAATSPPGSVHHASIQQGRDRESGISRMMLPTNPPDHGSTGEFHLESRTELQQEG